MLQKDKPVKSFPNYKVKRRKKENVWKVRQKEDWSGDKMYKYQQFQKERDRADTLFKDIIE